MNKVGISDCDHAAMNEEKRVFCQNNIHMELHQCRTEEDLIREMRDYTVIGNQYAPLTGEVFASLPNLRAVVRYGVGVNHIDVEAASRHGIAICNVPDYGIQEVASHAVALMLALCRKLIPMNESVQKGSWKYELSIPVMRFSEMTVGIIGIGRIGKSFANIVRNLNCRIVACDPLYIGTGREYPDYIEMMELDELLRISDVITIHSPLESSRDLIGKRELRMMKATAYIINTARGGIINEEDLAKALEQKWISGAACDVLIKEPPNGAPALCMNNNFICTPHMAWYSEQASSDLKTKLAEEMVRAVKGEGLHYKLN